VHGLRMLRCQSGKKALAEMTRESMNRHEEVFVILACARGKLCHMAFWFGFWASQLIVRLGLIVLR